ncbi:MAG: hypothetical protein IT331_18595 [Anaerolineae bacterium]|nr:hypothetical protein [Anaerolineae bacterium]
MSDQTMSVSAKQAPAKSSPLARFDPIKLAHLETANWVAYYQKKWGALLRASIGMVREAFSLNPFQAAYAAYLVARAEMAAAPFPDNDIPTAEAYMRRFYQYVKNVHKLDYDVADAARREVKWWIVHRELFDREDKQPLVEALYDLNLLYGAEPVGAHKAAEHRARAMVYSDEWIKQGKLTDSPLIAQEQAELEKCYTTLKRAINSE